MISMHIPKVRRGIAGAFDHLVDLAYYAGGAYVIFWSVVFCVRGLIILAIQVGTAFSSAPLICVAVTLATLAGAYLIGKLLL